MILTTYDLDEYVFDALSAGASGFLLKDVPPEELIYGVRIVARGDALLAPGTPAGWCPSSPARVTRHRNPPSLPTC